VGKFQLNPFGAYFALQSLFFGLVWGMSLGLLSLLERVLVKFDPEYNFYDDTSRAWAKAITFSSLSIPKISGTENIPSGPVVSELVPRMKAHEWRQ